MKKPLLMSLIATLFVATLGATGAAQAQGRIYRCGNEYTNTVQPGQKGCKLLEGGNVTVVQRPRASDVTRVASAGQASEVLRSRDASAQRQRDADARQILQTELARAETRQAELMAEYNNGEPEKTGPEFRNHQKYLDRVADLKANIERNESDMAGLRRELGRLPESQ
jgi:hypothetical protein